MEEINTFCDEDDELVLARVSISKEGYREHPLRNHEKIKLDQVPTLIWWQNDSVSERVVEHEFTNNHGEVFRQFQEKVIANKL